MKTAQLQAALYDAYDDRTALLNAISKIRNLKRFNEGIYMSATEVDIIINEVWKEITCKQ